MTDDRSGGVPAGDRSEDDPGDPGAAASPERVDQLAREFESRGRLYARAAVVRREPPVSANVGDRALVTPDGDLVGWIGGTACAQSAVVRAAMDAIEDDEPVLIGLAPDPEDVDRPGLESHPMTCHSGGTLEVFVEPVTPTPGLVVVGESPVARSLARLAGPLSYEVTVVVDPEADSRDLPGADAIVAATDPEAVASAIDGARFAVVASMGAYDDVGLEAALRAGPSYVGLVASDERRDVVADTVASRLDVDTETVVERVTTPAGLDVGAKTPEEIAVSVLAELVAVRRDAEGPVPLDVADAAAVVEDDAAANEDAVAVVEDDATASEDAAAAVEDNATVNEDAGTTDEDAGTAVDPVCGMDVDVDAAAATVEYGGETYYFCAVGCADAFEDDPGRFLDPGVAAGG